MSEDKRPVRIRRPIENMVYKESSFFFMVIAIAGLLIVGSFYIYKVLMSDYEVFDLVLAITAFVCSVFLSLLTVAILRQWSEVIGRFRMNVESSKSRVANMNLESYSVVEEKHTKALEQSIQNIGSDIIDGIIKGNRESQMAVNKAFSDLFTQTVLPIVNRSNELAVQNNKIIEKMQRQMDEQLSQMDQRVRFLSDDFARISDMERTVFAKPAETELPKPLSNAELFEKMFSKKAEESGSEEKEDRAEDEYEASVEDEPEEQMPLEDEPVSDETSDGATTYNPDDWGTSTEDEDYDGEEDEDFDEVPSSDDEPYATGYDDVPSSDEEDDGHEFRDGEDMLSPEYNGL